MNEFMIVLFMMLVVIVPCLALLYFGNRNTNKNLPMDDLAMIKFIKQQEMIEGMKYGDKDKFKKCKYSKI